MGDQYIDLFAAGAYALEGKLLQTLGHPSLAWVFFVLAGSGIVVSIVESLLEGDAQLWLRHLGTVAVASVLILMPHRIDLTALTYAAPGVIEALFGTRVGAAPHLTYVVERFGATVSDGVWRLMQTQPILVVPSVAMQVEELASDPRVLEDPQLKANLEIWRAFIVPWLLRQQPNLEASLRDANLLSALLNPAPSDERWVGYQVASRATAVKAILSTKGIDLAGAVADQSLLIRQITNGAGADPWVAGTSSVRIRMASQPPPTPDPPLNGSRAYYDAVSRGGALAQAMIQQLPTADEPMEVSRIEQLHDLIGRSILYAAAVRYLQSDSRLSTLGSYCQRLGEAACRSAQAPLIQASVSLRVPTGDRYNVASITTWLKEPLATVLLAVSSLLLGALASLVVAVLPFLLGVAKVVAILMSSVGIWMLLWPGRLRDAVSWMVLPVAFVALWSVLFNLWAGVETFLTAIASVVSHSEYGSFSAGRIMSIAISIGYLGLPVVALSILSGNALRALNHVGARLETALLMAWRARRTAISFGRRWLSNSPLARRWNQRVYRSVGLGTLRSVRPSAPRPRRGAAKAAATTMPGRHGSKADTKSVRLKESSHSPDNFKLE
jgi:hypothetical protein